jgi:AcrR family transcriptional regulator
VSIKRLNEPKVTVSAKAPERTNETVERILLAATRLFAAHGFDGVSTREIAAAVGLNVATVNYHVGGKRELYSAILLRIDELQAEIFLREVGSLHLETTALSTENVVLFVDRVLDGFVALALRHPEGALLRVRHALDSAGKDDAESGMMSGLLAAIDTMIARAKAAGLIEPSLDARMFTRGFMWLMQGYFIGAPLPGERRIDPADPAELAAFRAFLRRYTFTMLGLPQ